MTALCSDVGILENVSKLRCHLGILDDVVECGLGDGGLGFGRPSSQGRRAAGTELMSRLEGGLAARAVVEIGAFRPLFRREVVVTENLIVQLFVTHPGVSLEHVRVDVPACPVLDGLLGQSFSNPAADCSLSEVVCIDPFTVDTCVVGDLLDSSTDVLVVEGSVIGPVVVTPVLVDEGGVRFVTAWMNVKIGRDVAFTPCQGHGPARVLDVGSFINRDECVLSGKVDVADAERAHSTDAKSGVRQQRDEALVSSGARSGEQVVNLLLFEKGLGVDGLFLWRADFDFFGPIFTTLVEQDTESFSVVPNCPVGEFVFVAQVEDEFVDVLESHLDERDGCTLCCEAESVHVVYHRPTVDLALSGMQKLLDGVGVGADIRGIQLFELVLELTLVALDVVGVHIQSLEGRDYETSSSNPGGTTKTSYIIPVSVERQPSGDSSVNNQGSITAEWGVSA